MTDATGMKIAEGLDEIAKLANVDPFDILDVLEADGIISPELAGEIGYYLHDG